MHVVALPVAWSRIGRCMGSEPVFRRFVAMHEFVFAQAMFFYYAYKGLVGHIRDVLFVSTIKLFCM